MRKIKIAHVIDNLLLGGSEALMVRHVAQLAQSYPEYENSVWILNEHSRAAADLIAQLPIKPVFLEFTGDYRNPLLAVPCIARLRRLIHKHSPDVVHSYLRTSDVFSVLAAAGLPVRQVFHVLDRRNDRNSANLNVRLRTRAIGWLLRCRDSSFVAVSEACRKHAVKEYMVAPDSVVTAHNGIDADDFGISGLPLFSRQPTIIGMIARATPEKGHLYAIQACRLLVDQGMNVTLKIAGTGHQLPELQTRVGELRLADRIGFVGQVASAAEFYRELDVFIVPSIHSEGLPTTILEAMASGLPIIATDVGGAVEVVADGIHGLIIPPRDAPALARAIRWLIEHPGDARRMSEAALKHVHTKFTVESMTRTIVEQVYRPLTQAAAEKMNG